MDGWLRIFTDGSVDFPSDFRLARAGAGVFLGTSHPYNTSAPVHGKGITSFRAELQAVRMLIEGTQAWGIMVWITLDSEAVVGQLNELISNGPGKPRNDNADIWRAIEPLVCEAAGRGQIRVTWTKGHATEEHIAAGRSTPEEKRRNDEVDLLADKGREEHIGAEWS